MIVKCTECNASYSVDDEKVENKKFGFSCPKCGTNVIIDNRIKESVDFSDHEIAEPSFESPEEQLPHDDFSDTPITSESEPTVSDDMGDLIVDGTEFDMDSAAEQPAEDVSVPDTASDLDDFDLDGIEDISNTGIEEPVQPATSDGAPLDVSGDDESITIDDFDSAEDLSIEVPEEAAGSEYDFADDELPPKEEGVRIDFSDEDLLDDKEIDDLNNLDITDDDFKPLEEDITQKSRAGSSISDEPSFDDALLETGDADITELDLDLDAGATPSESASADGDAEIDVDESITIDLDTLDIQLEEAPPAEEADASIGRDFDFDAEMPPVEVENELPAETEFSDIDFETGAEPSEDLAAEADDDLTLDLDSLDITLDEIEEFKEGVQVDEDERLTIEDAGLTIDELESVKNEMPDEIIDSSHAFEEEEDLKLSIDEIDPDLRVEDLAPEMSEEDQQPIIENITEDQLPEIDFDKLHDEDSISEHDDIIPAYSGSATTGRALPSAEISAEEDYLDIETREQYGSFSGSDEIQGDTVPKGTVNFSIDYSLRYSRIGALLRLLGIYQIALIPHFLILLIYSVLSNIVGVFNWLIVLFTGQQVEDFSGIQEKTLRYMLATHACMTNTVEEPPQFTGQKDIDHSLQLNVIYPAKPSKTMSFLRLTGIGIIIVALPHLVLFMLLTLGSTIITLGGIISVIATGSWPNILFDFMVRYYRYAANVLAFMIGLVEKYPSFRFE